MTRLVVHSCWSILVICSIMTVTSLEARQSDSATVVATIERFHGALGAGDSLAALSLLAEDAVVVESGGIQSRSEYRSHHLAADIGFARAITRELGRVSVVVSGDVAWASSTSTARGTLRDREINSTSAELAVLSRRGDSWVIRAIHWSSRRSNP